MSVAKHTPGPWEALVAVMPLVVSDNESANVRAVLDAQAAILKSTGSVS